MAARRRVAPVTTTTPESRARIAYTAYCRGRVIAGVDWADLPAFDQLEPAEREAWMKAVGVIWDLATTGRATL
jgi:hypothetical protein